MFHVSFKITLSSPRIAAGIQVGVGAEREVFGGGIEEGGKEDLVGEGGRVRDDPLMNWPLRGPCQIVPRARARGRP